MSDRMSTQGGVSRDAAAMMRFEANKRSAVVAYILWFFFAIIGAHRFYLGKTMSAIVMLLLGVSSLAISFISFGILSFVMILPGLWALIDLFLIPGMARDYNTDLIRRMS